MNTPSPVQFPSPNDIQGAALALAALNITHPENDDEYGDLASRIMEDYCPLLRVLDAVLTPAEEEIADEMRDAIQSEAHTMVEEFLSSGSPLIQALTVQPAATE